MTNTMNTATPAAPQDTWDMTCAVLTALHQTHVKAQAEYQAKLEAANGNPFAPGLGGAGHLIETLKPALRRLEADMVSYARSNALAMPKLDG